MSLRKEFIPRPKKFTGTPKNHLDKMQKVNRGRKSIFEDAFQFKVLNPETKTSEIARMFNVRYESLLEYIKENMQKKGERKKVLTAQEAIDNVKQGMDLINDLANSNDLRSKDLAVKAMGSLEEYYPQLKTIFANIQSKTLSALDREVDTKIALGEMDIENIDKVQKILKMVNDTNQFIPKTPLVALQNNISTNMGAVHRTESFDIDIEPKKPKIEFNIRFVGDDDDDIIDVETKDG